MKKYLVVGLVLVGLLTMTGCEQENRIDVITTNWVFDTVPIQIDKDFKFQDFTKEYVGDECIVTIKYKKVSDKK